MTIAPEDRAFCERLASLSGWDVAKELGLSYFGDSDPIRHGGYFYNPARWDDWGYAPCVEFEDGPGDWETTVTVGSINRLTGDDLANAFRCCDTPPEYRDDVHAQVEACHGYAGSYHSDHEAARTYNLDTWAEWRLWRSILPMLRSIRDEA